MLSSRITTSFLCSTRRLAFSITISATCTWRVAGSSKVEETTSPITVRDIALAVLGAADLALDRVAGAQAVLPHLVGADIDVVRAGEVIGLRRAEEAEAVGQHLDRTLAHDLLAVLGLDLENGEHQILL